MKGVRQYPKKFSAFYDGPAIARCPTQERLMDDARFGSLKLLMAIEKAGLRP